MTRHDYERAAKAIGAAFCEREQSQNDLFSSVLDQFALMFLEDNQRFEYGKFEEACYRALDTYRRTKTELRI